jgi:cytochrome o ubiquinol oxidase operon protein cyoD
MSLLLTLLAYLLVTKDVVDGWVVIPAIVVLAVVQFVVQLVFFLHLGRETKPRWNLMAFLFMLLVVFIVVVGSLWIMANLDYNMMHRHGSDEYMLQQKDKGF